MYTILEKEYAVRCAQVSDINEHLPILRTLAENCNYVTEFGVFIGNATIGLMAGRPKKLIGYDISVTTAHKKVQDAIKLIKYIAKVSEIEYIFIEGDTHKITIRETDFLFLDTNQRERTFDELERHHLNVRKYIASHDTIYLPSQREAFTKFLSSHADEWVLKAHYNNNNGLIVIERICK